MTVITKNGYKISYAENSGTNSGTTAADVSITITVSDVSGIVDVIGIVLNDGNNSGAYKSSVSGNTVTVTAKSVPAGATTTVGVTVIGY